MAAGDSPSGASIVIPTTMRRETLGPVVEAALAAVSERDGEVILVANGAKEGRRRLELRSPHLRVLECATPRTGAARNIGLGEAANDLVIFTDDDCLVSPEWVARISGRLAGGAAAVATSLKMRRDGPITTFIDYQRIFEPPPIDAETVHFAIGASLAVRRDLIAAVFDEDISAGDDVLFGASLSDAGLPTIYAADAPPPLHLVPERLESVTERFFRYGTSNAKVLLEKGRVASAIPYARGIYRALCRNEVEAPRRFEEVADPNVREAFAALDVCVAGSVLAGYLDAAGRELGTELVRLDPDGMEAGWTEVERRLSEFVWDGNWHELPLDFGGWRRPHVTARAALAPMIAENLARNAPLGASTEADPAIDAGGELVAQRAEEIWRCVNEIWSEVRDGRLPEDDDAIALRMREDGIAFRDGMQTMETIALGPVAES
jgi:glycosyltransferase involved in cell wall biosynthesis